jgi:predicted amidohydrolase
MHDLNVTLVQTELHWERIDANLEMFDAQIGAVPASSDLIILPEMFSTGFSMAADQFAEPMSGKAVTWMQHKARTLNTALTGSLMIRQTENYYNRLVWTNPDGALITYDKKHLFRYAGEHDVYTPGEKLVTIDLKGWRIRPFICYDLRFPIWCRSLQPIYDLAIFVANWPAKRSAHWHQLLVARAIENQCFVVGVNRVGTDGKGFSYDGDSAVISPRGEVLYHAGDKAGIYTATLSYKLLQDYRNTFPAWKDADSDLIPGSHRNPKS